MKQNGALHRYGYLYTVKMKNSNIQTRKDFSIRGMPSAVLILREKKFFFFCVRGNGVAPYTYKYPLLCCLPAWVG